MFATPATVLSAFATLVAAAILFVLFGQAGRLRSKHKIQAPAMTGHPAFERAVRIQMNTIEQFVIFLPLLWLATCDFRIDGWAPGILGFVWCLGRIVYGLGYYVDAARRLPGFIVSQLALLALVVLGVVGIVNAWLAA